MSGAHLPEYFLQSLQKKAESLGLELNRYIEMLQHTAELLQPAPNAFARPVVTPEFADALSQAIAAQAHFLRHYSLED